MALLSVENLSVGYNSKKGMVNAVNNISFSIEQGRSLGFVGESGCGNTTIGMALMGLLPDNGSILQGDIIFNGKNLAHFKDEEWRAFRGKEISMIFQAAMNALNPVICQYDAFPRSSDVVVMGMHPGLGQIGWSLIIDDVGDGKRCRVYAQDYEGT